MGTFIAAGVDSVVFSLFFFLIKLLWWCWFCSCGTQISTLVNKKRLIHHYLEFQSWTCEALYTCVLYHSWNRQHTVSSQAAGSIFSYFIDDNIQLKLTFIILLWALASFPVLWNGYQLESQRKGLCSWHSVGTDTITCHPDRIWKIKRGILKKQTNPDLIWTFWYTQLAPTWAGQLGCLAFAM